MHCLVSSGYGLLDVVWVRAPTFRRDAICWFSLGRWLLGFAGVQAAGLFGFVGCKLLGLVGKSFVKQRTDEFRRACERLGVVRMQVAGFRRDSSCSASLGRVSPRCALLGFVGMPAAGLCREGVGPAI